MLSQKKNTKVFLRKKTNKRKQWQTELKTFQFFCAEKLIFFAVLDSQNGVDKIQKVIDLSKAKLGLNRLS